MTRRLVAVGRLTAPPATAPGVVLRWGLVDLGWSWPACRVCHRVFVPLDHGLCDGCRDDLAHEAEEARLAAARFEEGEEAYPNVAPTRLADVLPFRPTQEQP